MSITKYFPSYKAIGYTKKTTGVKGHLRLHTEPEFKKSIFHSKHCFFLKRGCMVPFFIDIGPDDIEDGIIKFESCNDPDQARELVSCTIYLHEDQILEVAIPEDKLVFSKFAGFDLINDESEDLVGRIISVDQYPEQEIANIKLTDGREALLPLNFYNVKGIDEDQRLIFVEIPEGIFDL